MDILLTILTLPFYVTFGGVIARAQIGQEIKLTLIGVSLILGLLLVLISPLLLFTSIGMFCFLTLWLSSIGILTPTHTISYNVRVKKIQLVKALLQMIGTPSLEELKGGNENNVD